MLKTFITFEFLYLFKLSKLQICVYTIVSMRVLGQKSCRKYLGTILLVEPYFLFKFAKIKLWKCFICFLSTTHYKSFFSFSAFFVRYWWGHLSKHRVCDEHLRDVVSNKSHRKTNASKNSSFFRTKFYFYKSIHYLLWNI